ncbi:hypothetical protein KP509_13G085700 [Ceratopteris richardii]|uniref:Uncharacterized protein n=1 Tax=Ceratopteris richardii TaxID=49495 RepID=A0A8T2TKU4_CERRI|nr:hypothetical protein KP509_13G085700 [Ceratopteris richardii]
MACQPNSQPLSIMVVAPPAARDENRCEEYSSATSATATTSFVQAIDKKARGYLKLLERTLSFSALSSKDDDASNMTIEFLRARLQAQRAEYKAEKLKAQHLARKVLELEQRLKLEAYRKKTKSYDSMDRSCATRNGKCCLQDDGNCTTLGKHSSIPLVPCPQGFRERQTDDICTLHADGQPSTSRACAVSFHSSNSYFRRSNHVHEDDESDDDDNITEIRSTEKRPFKLLQ